MVFEHIEKLKREYTDKYVSIAHMVPELKRFEGRTGIVRTVNMSGRALVEFLGTSDISWYDIDIDYLKIVDQPPPPPSPKKVTANDATPEKPSSKTPTKASSGTSTADILAMARGKKPAEQKKEEPTAKEEKELSTAEKLALLRGEKPSKPPQDEPPADQQAPKKPSTADILAMARAQKKKDTEQPGDSDSASPDDSSP